MNTSLRHSWKVSPQEAIRIQEELRKKLRLRPPKTPFKTVAAADVSYSCKDEELFAAFLILSYPDLTLLESAAARGSGSFPYIPGLLSFREAPILLKAFSKLERHPDVILIDGQGIAHPRSMGTPPTWGSFSTCHPSAAPKAAFSERRRNPDRSRGVLFLSWRGSKRWG